MTRGSHLKHLVADMENSVKRENVIGSTDFFFFTFFFNHNL